MEPNSLNQAPVPPSVQPTSTQPVTPPAQLQAIVSYMPNVSIVGSKMVLLEWGADNRIRMYDMNFDTKQATGIMFDAALTDITKVTGTVNMLTFHIGGKSYRSLFAAMQTAGLGGVGAIAAFHELNASGVNLWIKKLKENNVQVKLFGWGKTWAVAIGIVVIIAGIVIANQIASGTF
jgi:hypothetical protein